MPSHWGTNKKISEATADDAARGAVNNLKNLVAERHNIATLSSADQLALGALATELCKQCQRFALTQPLSADRARALASAVAGFQAAYCGR